MRVCVCVCLCVCACVCVRMCVRVRALYPAYQKFFFSRGGQHLQGIRNKAVHIQRPYSAMPKGGI